MQPSALSGDLEFLWLWLVAPVSVIAAVVVSIRMRAPQFRMIPLALRSLLRRDPQAEGSVPPAASAAFALVATYGAAGAIGAATAVSLGGAGAVAWVWVFAIVLAPLRIAETMLARTAPPGRAGAPTGSLAARLLADVGPFSGLGLVLVVLVPLAGLGFFGGVHGAALLDTASQLFPGGAVGLVLVVAVLAGIIAMLPLERTGALLGWIALVALIALFGAALIAFFGEIGRGVSGFGRAVMEAIDGAPDIGAFAGATASEIALAALLHVLPPVAATGGLDGALHADARGATKRQAAIALLAPLAYALVTSILGLALVATGAFSRPAPERRPVNELVAYRSAFETVSQRQEEDRLFSGYLRIMPDVGLGAVATQLATERGVIEAPRFYYRGRKADILLHYQQGRIVDMQKRGELRALHSVPLSETAHVEVRGRMLPRGALLIAQAMHRSGGLPLRQLALLSVLILCLLGAVAWGVGIARTLRATLPEKSARFGALVPSVGLALAAFGWIPDLATLGAFAAGILAIATAVVLIVRAKEAADLAR